MLPGKRPGTLDVRFALGSSSACPWPGVIRSLPDARAKIQTQADLTLEFSSCFPFKKGTGKEGQRPVVLISTRRHQLPVHLTDVRAQAQRGGCSLLAPHVASPCSVSSLAYDAALLCWKPPRPEPHLGTLMWTVFLACGQGQVTY